MPCGRMMARGSSEGSENGSSFVATSLTQSVEPGSGTSSTLIPASAYQPSLVAIAKGAPAEVTVFAHQPTRTFVSAAVAADHGSATPTNATAANASVGPRFIIASLIIVMSPRCSDIVLEAVDDEILSGDEAGLGSCQEDDKLRHVVRFADAAQRDAGPRDLRPAVARQRIAELGLDDPGTDRIDEDRRSELLGERACHPEDPGLRRGIGKAAHRGRDAAGIGVERRHRSDAAAALLQHDRRDGANVIEAALQVDRDGAVELRLLDLEDTLRLRLAGVVEEEIDAAPVSPDLAGNRLRTVEQRDIRFEDQRRPTDLADLRRGALHLGDEQI